MRIARHGSAGRLLRHVRSSAARDQVIHLRQKARDVFELRYKETIDPDKNRWELCSRVLARKDVVEKLSESW